VVFEEHAIGAGGEGLGDAVAEFLRAGAGVGGEGDATADLVDVGLEARVRNLAADGEGDERAGVGVDDGAEVGRRR
jgi:hypothetical protein